MIRKITKAGPVDLDGYLLDELGNKTKLYKPEPKIRDLNIGCIYFWHTNLNGKLIQDVKPPNSYHGHSLMYVREDIEKNQNNTSTSHLRVYYDNKLMAQTKITVPDYDENFLGDHEDAGGRETVRSRVDFLLNDNGWRICKTGERFRTIKKAKPLITLKKDRHKKLINNNYLSKALNIVINKQSRNRKLL